MSDTNIPEHLNATDKIRQEINELTEIIRLERRKHSNYKILQEVAFSCAKNNSQLNHELQAKLYDILMLDELKQCMDLPENNVLLGLTSLNLEDLNYEEKEKVREIVQRGLLDKSRSIFQELQKLGVTVIEDRTGNNKSALNFCIEDKVLLRFKNELKDIQKQYIIKLQELIEILENMVELKIKVVPKIVNEKISACEVTLELHRLRTEIVDTKARVNVFTETSKSMNAYREIVKDILQQQTECKQEIEQLEELKEKYKQVSCKQYNEILKNYLQYKNNLEKKRLYNQLWEK